MPSGNKNQNGQKKMVETWQFVFFLPVPSQD